MRENGLTPQASREEINVGKKLAGEKRESGFKRTEKETRRDLRAVISVFFASAPCNVTNS